ncbi:MAG: allophanate hydrolase, partial [Proteobacteria bacterium]|nr:allophanate hydrolase [Pseudomonadota bacterium]
MPMIVDDQPLDVHALRAALATGAVSARDVVEAVIARVGRRADDPVWINRESDAALRARAAELDRLPEASRGAQGLPLFGIPFAVKDNIDVAGLPTTAGCSAFAYRPGTTATAVQRLLDAGAIHVGKTNLDQFATGLVGVRSPYGVPVNPFDAAYVPGGSSSGSAVAVAAGLVSFSLGTDTAGSGRVPAAFNNIVGLKPTRGLVSNHGTVPACRSLDCIAVFAHNCPDASAVLDVIAAPDPLDPWSRGAPAPADTAGASIAGPRGLRFGVLAAGDREFFGDARAAAAYDRAVQALAALGAIPVPFDYAPFAEVAALLYNGLQITEGARRFSATDTFEAMYRLQELRAACSVPWRGAGAVDLLLLPTAPTIYRLDEVEAEPLLLNTRLGRYTNFVNLLDLSALAVPAGLRDDGLPAGVTLIGMAFGEQALLETGARLQAALNVSSGACGVPVPQAAGIAVDDAPATARSVRLAVVGAHLSGMPLNGQLTSRAARLVAPTTTAPCYRLHALPGSVPPRPGLVRIGAGGQGATAGLETPIAVEVWELSVEAFGAFVAEVPPPLAIGTVTLADGSE